MTKRASLILALCALASCHGSRDEKGDAAAHPPATGTPVVSVPAPLPPEQALAAAFAVAFPKGGLIGMGDKQMQYVAKALAPLPGGTQVAVLADGTGVGLNTCHACAGLLRIVYLARQGSGFAPLAKPIERTIEGDGFGSPPDWKLDTTGPVPMVTVTAGYTGQGCTVTRTDLWGLRPEGVVRDKAASRQEKDGC